MKKIFIILLTTLAGTILPGCDNKLDEDPKSILTPDFFSTKQGFQGGLDAAYAGNRMLWGNQDLFTITVIGTDEFFTGQDGNNNINKYNSNYTTAISQPTNVWKNCYTYINTCNGVIASAPAVTGFTDDVKNRMVAEAKFLRANYYFVLVQFFGDVTLLENFQTVATTSAERHPMASVYDFIIEDLNEAIATLPVGPFSTGVQPGRATKAAAMHLLAKVYLTRGGSSASKPDDFRNAHTIARDLIDNIAPANGLKLLEDFAKVFEEGNEANNEVLWSVQHTSNLGYNGPNNSGGADNVLNHMWVPQYEEQPGMKRSVEYGRPYIRCVPTRWLTDTAFAERVNDTRYSKTFQTVWYANNEGSLPVWAVEPTTNTLPPGVAGDLLGKKKFQVGDTAIWMPGYAVPGAKMDRTRYKIISPGSVKSAHYKTKDSKGNIVALTYDGYTIKLSPAMKKFFDTKRADLNYPSVRPVIVYRLADTYLIAAEALLRDGQAGTALQYFNAIRRRAAFPTGNAGAMEITESALSLDFILDERSRELCGENMRWWDLVRTGKLLERVRKHNNEARPNIQPKHVLRPIPQDQIDATTTGTPYPQNPGW